MFFLMNFILILLSFLSLDLSAKTTSFQLLGRSFLLETPRNERTANRPLLVLLHGCKQNPDIILRGSRMDEMARAKNFFVLAPEQSVLMNIDHCWNWFFDFNQRRSLTNEMGQIMAAVQLVSQTYKIDTDRIFVAGMSAGGVMSANFAACYPDVFSGAAIHSGLAFKIAENLAEAQTVLTASKLKSPSYLGKKAYDCGRIAGRRKLSRMVLIHGDRDSRVDSFHSKLISETNEVLMDYVDDGKRNYSARFKKGEKTIRHLTGYDVDVQEKIYPKFSEITYLVRGMAHSWGGGKPITPNFEENAPSSTDFILNYFGL